MILSGFILTSILLSLAQPEAGIFAIISLVMIIIVLGAIVAAFDFYRYKKYIHWVVSFYRERVSDTPNAEISYELKFNEEEIAIDNDFTKWSTFKYYYSNDGDLYLFKNKQTLVEIWSGASMDEKAFKSLEKQIKSRLKILPAAKKIVRFGQVDN